MAVTTYQQDATDFLNEFKKKTIDPRMEEYQQVVSEFSERYDRAYQMINPYYAEAYRDLSFYLSNQWSPEAIEYLNDQNREALTYNMCMRLINLIEGIQRQNRLSSIVCPVKDKDEGDYLAELYTDCLQHINAKGDFYEQNSISCKDAMVTGISFINTWMDYRNDPINGDPFFSRGHWNDMIWDPFFYNRDLSDCEFVSRRKYVSRSEAISLVPDKEDVIRQLPYGTRDNKFTYIPYVRQGALNKLMNYTEYWCRKWVMKDVLVDMETGQTVEWKGSRERLQALMIMMPQIQKIRKPVPEVQLAIIIENCLVYWGRNPYGIGDYPFTPHFAIYEPSYDLYQWKLQSLIRLIRDPQLELNKRKSKMVDILDSQIYPGYIVKENAVTNQDSLFKSGQGPVLFVKHDAQLSDVQKMPAADIPPGHFEMMSSFEKDIPNILGINPEMLGMPEQDKVETAAILAKMRVNAGLVSLRRLFDGFSETQRICQQKVLKMVIANWTPEKVALVTGKKVPEEFFNDIEGKYNIVVEEGVLTDTQRQSQFMSYLALRQMGIDVPDSVIIKNSNLNNKRELNEILDAKAKMEQAMAQQQNQLQLQQMQVMTDSLESKAQSDQALAAERLNKIHLDQALNKEREARAQEERTAGTLNMIKSLKEIESLNTQDLKDKFALLKDIAGKEVEQERAQAAEASPLQNKQMKENVQV